MHEKAFNPAKDIHRKVKADFDHKTDLNEVKKNYRDEDGAVKTENRNFLTKPPKKGATFGGIIPYKEDPYDNKKVLAKKELEKHKSLLQEKPFSQRVKPRFNFNSDKEVYGEDVKIPHRPPPEKKKPLMEHDKPFAPSHPAKKGYNKTLDKFPVYKEDPPKRLMKKQKTEDDPEPLRWKPTHNNKSRPSASVTCHTKNLRCEFPSVFKRGGI